MRRFLAAACGALGVIFGMSCGDSTAAGPGFVKIRLVAPPTAVDSAIVFTIDGPAGLISADPGVGLRLFHQPFGAGSTRFALTGLLANGATILTVGVPDIGAFSQYTGTIEGVAQPDYQLRQLPGGYALALTR